MTRKNPPAPAISLRLGDVARIADTPPETIRSRVKAEIFDLGHADGWRAFSVAEAAAIALHAEIKRQTGDDALAAAIFEAMQPRLRDALATVPAGDERSLRDAFGGDTFAVCARDPAGRWGFELAEGPFAVDAAIARCCAESYDATPIFLTVNLGAVLRRIGARILATPAAVAVAPPSESSSRSLRYA